MARLVTIFGGSGFLGRHLTQALSRRGWRVRAAVRRPDLAGHLQPLGMVGQIHAVQANLRYPDSVARAVDGADAVVNLVGILHEGGRQTFSAVQAQGPRIVAEAAAKAGVESLVQVSAIGADPNSPADYARSKAAGEAATLAAFPTAIIMRPSIVFGPEDQFFNRFADMARFLPFLPLIGGGETKFQPVYVGDVAEAIARALEGAAKPGTTYELGGPEVKSFKALLEYILAVTGRSRPLVPLPFPIARLQASVMELLPSPMLTVDQVRMLETDNVVSAQAIAARRTLAGLGVTPTTIEAVVPSYLYRFRKHGQFERAEIAR
ncbi:MAG: complex I NDUFA9 subunit family protein [Methylobacterium sp.]|nr:complex I NDUFA9 subunit family protein [Methylobacterium sp.]MCA3601666.1 complex I NDUFA9 subunit family protein [Methylobacterium sp.]MCA3607913.1 complex I NDUFA9 subunit family protein [Methylobacterium sp.]MCA3608016.1 complex I NDUFA9 subunit family protein [Methylobacterium sp.]MCA3616740.1 complex I NDUFA9 subunit family protein [Methylobacterium sp.]